LAEIDYRIGDTLRWGGNDIGEPGHAKVQVAGYPEGDPYRDPEWTYDIIIEHDVIISYQRRRFETEHAEYGDCLYKVLE